MKFGGDEGRESFGSWEGNHRRSGEIGRRVLQGVASFAATAVLGLVGSAAAQNVTPTPHLEMKRFVGVWYEIARFAGKKDRCATDGVVIYTAHYKPSRFAVVNSCKAMDNGVETKNGSVRPQGKSEDGKLTVTYTWPFRHKQWVLGTGVDYEWALIGSPDHKTLMVLSRSRTLPPQVMVEIKAKAAGEGFDMGKLVAMAQTR